MHIHPAHVGERLVGRRELAGRMHEFARSLAGLGAQELTVVDRRPIAGREHGLVLPELVGRIVEFAFLLALETLDPRARAVLILRDVLGYSGPEVAEFLELGPAEVRVILHRARKALDQARPRPRAELGARLRDRRIREALERFMAAIRRINGEPGVVAELPPTPLRTARHGVLHVELDDEGCICQVQIILASRKLAGVELRPDPS